MKSKKIYILPLLFLGIVFFSACWPKCEVEYLGEKPFHEASNDWIKFTGKGTVVMKNSSNHISSFTYSSPLNGMEELEVNCETRKSSCCDYYHGQTMDFSLASGELGLTFDFLMMKDFDRWEYADKVSIGVLDDALSISFKGAGLRIVLSDDTLVNQYLFADSVQLINRTFTDVYYRENQIADDTVSATPVAVYFTKADGIVGFELANGEKWELQ